MRRSQLIILAISIAAAAAALAPALAGWARRPVSALIAETPNDWPGVEGRLAGRRLEPGCFLSPDLSYDGRTILFAYTEGRAEGIEWSPRASFHIFRAGLDGTGLVGRPLPGQGCRPPVRGAAAA